MANLLNNQAPAAPPSYSEADLRAARADQAAQMLAQENQRLQQAVLNARQPVQMQAPRPVGPDPLMVYSEKGLTQTAEENRRLLDQGVRGRARQEVDRAKNELREEMNGALDYQRKELMLSSILTSNPDIAADPDGYAAAIGKAQFRTGNQNLDAVEMARLAVQIYRQERQQPQQVPYVEGAGRPGNGPGVRVEEPKKNSFYQEFYGGENTDEELIDKPWNNEEQVLVYIDGKNAELESLGAEPQKSKIRDVQGETMMRRARTKQRGAA